MTNVAPGCVPRNSTLSEKPFRSSVLVLTLPVAEAGEQVGVVADDEVAFERTFELLYMSTVSSPSPPPPSGEKANRGEVGPKNHRHAVANAKAAITTCDPGSPRC